MARRFYRHLALVALFSLIASVAWAGKVRLGHSGIKDDHLFAYTYRVVFDGYDSYPPMPREEMIIGDDMIHTPEQYYPYIYKLTLDASQHLPGGYYSYKIKRYESYPGTIGNNVVQQGQALATSY